MWAMESPWPEFMLHDPVGNRWFGELADRFPELQHVALGDEGELLGRILALPFAHDGADEDLLDSGWDSVLDGASRIDAGTASATVSLIEARIAPGNLGRGLSREMLLGVREHLSRRGVRDLYAPVRPTAKALEPRLPMADYVARRREDGLPFDPWLRVHVRVGGRIVGVSPLAMVVPGSLDQWRRWTGLAFDRSGSVEVPGALNPVLVSVEHDHAVYVEPNVWVHHRLAG